MSTTMNFQLSVPPTHKPQEQALRRSILAATVHTLQHVFDRATTTELIAIDHILTQAATQATALESADTSTQDLLLRVSQGRTYSASERVALEVANQECLFELRHSVLGDTVTASGAARLLGTTRQAPYDRAKKGTLLAIMDRGAWRFPRWQFDPQGPGGVVAGLPEVIESLRLSSFAKALWLTRGNATLEGRTPLAALLSGEQARVLDAAIEVGVS